MKKSIIADDLKQYDSNLHLSKFTGSRVFITGDTGFKGSWLAFLLSQLGADVMGFALPPTSNRNHFELLELNKKITHIDGDIRNASQLSEAINKFQPDFVFHLAAQALVRKSYADPVGTFSTNVMGSVSLLDAVRKCNSIRSLVFVTSDKCYENVEWIWGYRENDLLGGRDPYSASKGAAELIFSSYVRSYFSHRHSFGAATARAGNVIGGGDWANDRIVPDCIRSIEADKPIVLRNPGATRPWQHVLEPIAGYLLLAIRLFEEPKKWGGSWNFGPSTLEVRTVRNVAEVIIKLLGKGSIEIIENNNNLHEAQLLQLNCEKAHQLLGWIPRWNVDHTLNATALWYKTIIEGGSAEDITRNQIKSYFKEV